MTPSAGQIAQMSWEQMAAQSLSIPWETRFFCPRGSMPELNISHFSTTVGMENRRSLLAKARAWPRFRHEYYDWLLSVQHEYDALLIRYNFHDPVQLQFLRTVRKPVYLVHHTLEVPELFSSHTLLGTLRGVADAMMAPRTLRAAYGVVGVTSEIADYEVNRSRGAVVSSFVYPNGIEYDGPLAIDQRQGVPQLLFVAGIFAAWHGLDILLASLRRCDSDLVLHLVGQVGPAERELALSDPRVRLHGHIPRDAIASIAASCDVGISSLMLERNSMRQACTLKVREYLKLGLPVYAGYEDVFPENFPYYRNGPCDIEAMLSFASAMRTVRRQVVADAARPFIEKSVLLRRLHEFISCDIAEGRRA